MGHDNHRVRRLKAKKLRRSGLDASSSELGDVDKIVRIENVVKRNLYRALIRFERSRRRTRSESFSTIHRPDHDSARPTFRSDKLVLKKRTHR